MRDERKSRKKRFDWEKKALKERRRFSFLFFCFSFFSSLFFSDLSHFHLISHLLRFSYSKRKRYSLSRTSFISLATPPPATMSFERRRRYSSSWLFLRNCLNQDNAFKDNNELTLTITTPSLSQNLSHDPSNFTQEEL